MVLMWDLQERVGCNSITYKQFRKMYKSTKSDSNLRPYFNQIAYFCCLGLDSNYWLTVTNPLLQLRRISDQGLRNARDQFRRLSNSGSKLLSRIALVNECRPGNGPPGRPGRGGLRKGSADPMSILKDLNEGGGGSVGFSRKSVSFCQRDNVHVYKSEPYYEDEDDIVDLASLSSKCCSVAN